MHKSIGIDSVSRHSINSDINKFKLKFILTQFHFYTNISYWHFCIDLNWYWLLFNIIYPGSSRGRDRIVVGFTTTYVISAYHHWCCGFYSNSGRCVQHYVIVCQWLVAGQWFSLVSSMTIYKTGDHDITKSGIKHHKTKQSNTH